MKTVKLPLSALIEDLSLYPRATVFDGHVGDLEDAIRAGVELPPIIIDKKSKRIVDGFHRRRALKKVHGPDYVVDVEVRSYASEAELFIDAVRLNSGHGRRMSTFDYARCATIAGTLGIDLAAMASALSLTAEKLGEITVAKSASSENGTLVPIRHGMSHMAGRRLTQAQERAAHIVGGQSPMYHANQLIALLEADMLPEDERVLDRLRVLAALVTEKVSAPVA